MWDQAPHEYTVESAKILGAGRAIDLGCGEGYDALHLASQGFDVTAVDISDRALARLSQAAQESQLEIDVVNADLTVIDLSIGYNLVASYGALHFLGKEQHREKLEHIKDSTYQNGIHSLYTFGNQGDFYDIGNQKFWFPDKEELRDLYDDWRIIRIQSKATEMLLKGDNGEPLHNSLLKLLAQKS